MRYGLLKRSLYERYGRGKSLFVLSRLQEARKGRGWFVVDDDDDDDVLMCVCVYDDVVCVYVMCICECVGDDVIMM